MDINGGFPLAKGNRQPSRPDVFPLHGSLEDKHWNSTDHQDWLHLSLLLISRYSSARYHSWWS